MAGERARAGAELRLVPRRVDDRCDVRRLAVGAGPRDGGRRSVDSGAGREVGQAVKPGSCRPLCSSRTPVTLGRPLPGVRQGSGGSRKGLRL